MLELPEVINISEQLKLNMSGKKVSEVLPPTKIHKFCWYNGEPSEYNSILSGQSIVSATGFGIYVEIIFSKENKLCFNDGVNARIVQKNQIPKNYQLAILFDDDTALVFTVAMYGGIILHDGGYDNEYYLKSKSFISPFSSEFNDFYNKTFEECRSTKLSAKAFIATEQRFPGIGNGVAQDILFKAGLHPKCKISTLDDDKKLLLLKSIHSVLSDMKDLGGRDTEKDIFGNSGRYRTIMSKKSFNDGCPVCGGAITKEAYLGGSVYYCPECQTLNPNNK